MLYSGFQLCGGLVPLTPALFMDQLYFPVPPPPFFAILAICRSSQARAVTQATAATQASSDNTRSLTF